MTNEQGAVEIPRPLCSVCKKNLAVRKWVKRGVYSGFKSKCSTCSRGYSKASDRFWTTFKKDYCEYPDCTATIVHRQQLDVDHIDGDKTNNDPSNLMTICKNCHALKTHLNRDYLNLAYRSEGTKSDSNG